jgi:subtilisin family serine protease
MRSALILSMFVAFGMPTTLAFAQTKTVSSTEVLIKLSSGVNAQSFAATFSGLGGRTESKIQVLTDSWIKIESTAPRSRLMRLTQNPAIEYIQPNYTLGLLEDYRVQDPLRRAALKRGLQREPEDLTAFQMADNPEIPALPSIQKGKDPLLTKQWGLTELNVTDAWKKSQGDPNMIVAVLDTGVDYTHEDLNANIWRNPGEIGLDSEGKDKASNGIDDDNNGYIDDVIGWDFVSKDNKPFDLAVDPKQLLISGGNPGHGTHCAGTIGATANNNIGIAGLAPNVKIMPLRFISEKGSGTTADAVLAIRYAVDNGAKILSNSWGGESPRAEDSAENRALIEAIQYAESKGALFVAAAGNGRAGNGFDMDTDSHPVYPASYEFESILSVAALDQNGSLAPFSNFGIQSVDLGAPGVAVFSTTVGSKYSDKVLEFRGFEITWDGTSMAAPHAAAAAAWYWSQHPTKTALQVKEALMTSAEKIPALAGKLATEGRLRLP